MAAEGGIGFGVGLLGGAVGLIIGSIRLPALIRILRVDPRIAAGSNLFIGFIMGSLGWIGHVARGQVDYALLIPMGAAAMVGSYYGAKLTGRVRLDTLITAMGGRAGRRRSAACLAGVAVTRDYLKTHGQAAKRERPSGRGVRKPALRPWRRAPGS